MRYLRRFALQMASMIPEGRFGLPPAPPDRHTAFAFISPSLFSPLLCTSAWPQHPYRPTFPESAPTFAWPTGLSRPVSVWLRARFCPCSCSSVSSLWFPLRSRGDPTDDNPPLLLRTSFWTGRGWPVWLGLGFGLGSSYADCQRIAKPVTLPNVRVLPSGSPEARAAPSSASTFELLQVRAGELFAQASQAAKHEESSPPAPAQADAKQV